MKRKSISGGLRKKDLFEKRQKKFSSSFNNHSCIK